MTDGPHPLFHRDGSTWTPQTAAVGPWSPNQLHGGPVAALCVSIAEELLPGEQWATSRLTLDFVRPVPTQPLAVESRVRKKGRRVSLIEIEISAIGKSIATALVQRISMATVELPSLAGSSVELDPPSDMPDDFLPVNFDLATAEPPPFVRLATEMRTPRPEGIYSHQPTEAWVQVFADLTPGIPLSPSAAVAAAADYTNALGAPAIPGANMLFPNADLNVHLVRVPEDAWVRMSPVTSWQSHGIGHTRCDLWDRCGRLGTSTVTLALANRT